MKLLLKRSQGTSAILQRPIFKLWAKLEFEGDEEEVIKRYDFSKAILIEALQPALIRNTAIIAAVAAIAAWLILNRMGGFGSFLSLAAGGGAGWFYFDRTRETIYVRDLIHGRYFDCRGVIRLGQKEAWLGVVTAYMRQVMETAKHWDGTEIREIEALSKEEAKLVAIRGL